MYNAKALLTVPLDKDQFRWNSADGKRSGVRNLNQVINSLERAIVSGEKDISAARAEWDKVDTVLRLSARETMGDHDFASLMTDVNALDTWYSQDHQAMLAELEAEQQHVRQLVEEAGRSACKDLEIIEEVVQPPTTDLET